MLQPPPSHTGWNRYPDPCKIGPKCRHRSPRSTGGSWLNQSRVAFIQARVLVRLAHQPVLVILVPDQEPEPSTRSVRATSSGANSCDTTTTLASVWRIMCSCASEELRR